MSRVDRLVATAVIICALLCPSGSSFAEQFSGDEPTPDPDPETTATSAASDNPTTEASTWESNTVSFFDVDEPTTPASERPSCSFYQEAQDSDSSNLPNDLLIQLDNGLDWIQIAFQPATCTGDVTVSSYEVSVQQFYPRELKAQNLSIPSACFSDDESGWKSINISARVHCHGQSVPVDLQPGSTYNIIIQMVRSELYESSNRLSAVAETMDPNAVVLTANKSPNAEEWHLSWNCKRHSQNLTDWNINLSTSLRGTVQIERIKVNCRDRLGAISFVIDRNEIIYSTRNQSQQHSFKFLPCLNYFIGVSPSARLDRDRWVQVEPLFYEAPGEVTFQTSEEVEQVLSLNWEEPKLNKECLLEYQVLIANNETENQEETRVILNKHAISWSSPVKPCTTYRITIFSIGSVDYSSTSSLVSSKSVETALWCPETNVQAVDDCLDVRWSVNSAFSHWKCVSVVRIFYREGSLVQHKDASSISPDGEMKICELSPETNYEVTVELKSSVSNTLSVCNFISVSPPTGTDATTAALIAVIVILIIVVIVVAVYVGKPSLCHSIFERLWPFSTSPKRSGPGISAACLSSRRNYPIKISDLPTTTRQLCSEAAKMLEIEFENLRVLSSDNQFSTSHANKLENKLKNRYANILPYDHSRVILSLQEDDPYSDYINASYIMGFNKQKEYIATQGPKESTLADWWRMIWEQNSRIIIMVTALEERGKPKCARYWPDVSEVATYGNIRVKTTEEVALDSYIIRHLELTSSDETTKAVKQLYLKNWPDFGCPDNPEALIQFIDTARDQMRAFPDTGPIVIHCSAGVGRTGTYIAVDWLMQEARTSKKVDIFSVVLRMRECRNSMVQTEDQYEFVYRCLSHYVAEHLLSGKGAGKVSKEEEKFISVR